LRSIAEQAIAEVVGTLALVFIGAGAVAVLAPELGSSAVVGIAFAHGLVLAIMVSNLGHISGGHFNPAVTASVWVAGKIETGRAAVYVGAQLVGAAIAAALLRWALPEDLWTQTSLGVPAVAHADGITAAKAVLIEAVLTFFLVFTVFAVAVDDRGVFKSIAGLPIGLVLTMDILMGGTLTGAAMNPARAFGPALVSGTWTDFWVYVAGPLIGGVLAATLYLFAFLGGRAVVAPRTEQPIGGGPEADLPSSDQPAGSG
jgi:aquaporin Z